MKSNLKEFKGVKELARSLNIPLSYGYNIQPKMDGSRKPIAFRITPKQAIELEEKNAALLCDEKRNLQRKKQAFLRRKSIFYCDAGRNSLSISPYGQMNLCVGHAFPGYDILKRGFSEAWEKLRAFVESANPKRDYPCGKCKFLAFCQSCPAESWLAEKDMYACVPYFKELARIEYLKNANPKCG